MNAIIVLVHLLSLVFIFSSSCFVWRLFEDAASDSFPDVDEVLMRRKNKFIKQLRPIEIVFIHALMISLANTVLDILLDVIHVTVQFLSVNSLVFESCTWQLLKVLGTSGVLWIIVLTY